MLTFLCTRGGLSYASFSSRSTFLLLPSALIRAWNILSTIVMSASLSTAATIVHRRFGDDDNFGDDVFFTAVASLSIVGSSVGQLHDTLSSLLDFFGGCSESLSTLGVRLSRAGLSLSSSSVHLT